MNIFSKHIEHLVFCFFYLLLLIVTGCDPYELGGELKITEEFMQYVPDSDTLVYMNMDGEISELFEDSISYIKQRRVSDDTELKYYYVDSYSKIYKGQGLFSEISFNINPVIPSKVLFYDFYMSISINSQVKEFSNKSIFGISEVSKNYYEYQNNEYYNFYDSVYLNDKYFFKVVNLVEKDNTCNPDINCPDSIYYNQEYGIVCVVFSDGQKFTIKK